MARTPDEEDDEDGEETPRTRADAEPKPADQDDAVDRLSTEDALKLADQLAARNTPTHALERRSAGLRFSGGLPVTPEVDKALSDAASLWGTGGWPRPTPPSPVAPPMTPQQVAAGHQTALLSGSADPLGTPGAALMNPEGGFDYEAPDTTQPSGLPPGPYASTAPPQPVISRDLLGGDAGVPPQVPGAASPSQLPPSGAEQASPQVSPGAAPPGLPATQAAVAPGIATPRGVTQPGSPRELQLQERQMAESRAAAQAAELDAAAKAGIAQSEHAQKLLGVQKQELDMRQRADEDYVARRAQNEEQARRETLGWMEKWESAVNAEPDPTRYWSEGGSARRVLWFLAVAGHSLSGNQQAVQQVFKAMDDEVSRDVGVQKDQLAARREGLQVEERIMRGEHEQAARDAMDDREMRLVRYQALGRYLEAQAMAPTSADQAAGIAALRAKIQAENAKLAVDFHKEALDSRNKELDRAHAERLEGIRQWNETSRKKMELFVSPEEAQAWQQSGVKGVVPGMPRAALLEQVKLAGEVKKEQAKQQADTVELPANITGVHVGSGGIVVPRGEKGDKARAELANLPEMYDDFDKVADALKRDDGIDLLLGKDPAAQASAIRLAAHETKGMFSRTTQPELEAIAGTISGGALDPKVRERASAILKDNLPALRKMAEENRDKFLHRAAQDVVVKYHLGPMPDPRDVWFEPKAMTGAADAPPPTDAQLARQGVQVPRRQEPSSVHDFEVEREAGRLPELAPEAAKALADVPGIFGWQPGDKTGLPPSLIMGVSGHRAQAIVSGEAGVPEPSRKAAVRRLVNEAGAAERVAREHLDDFRAELGGVRKLNTLSPGDRLVWEAVSKLKAKGEPITDEDIARAAQRAGFDEKSDAVVRALSRAIIDSEDLKDRYYKAYHRVEAYPVPSEPAPIPEK